MASVMVSTRLTLTPMAMSMFRSAISKTQLTMTLPMPTIVALTFQTKTGTAFLILMTPMMTMTGSLMLMRRAEACQRLAQRPGQAQEATVSWTLALMGR